MRADRRRAIIEAARTILRDKGIDGTRMDDIAGEVGIARPNLYRYFSNKEELVRALLHNEIVSVNDERRRRIPISGPVRDIIAESLVIGAELSASNELLSVVFTEEFGDVAAKLVAADSGVMWMECDYWQPILDHGRRRGELVSRLTDERIMHWFMSNHYVFMSRRELVSGDLRRWIEDFVVAPIVVRPAPATNVSQRRKQS